MRSLLSRDLRKNEFLIYRVSKSGKEYPIQEDSLFLAHTEDRILIEGKLKIVFEGQSEDRNYTRFYTGSQTSTIISGPAPITIYNNGHFEDLKSVFLDGYLGYRECLSNLVPLGYQPSSPLK